jgi:ankyrin repeat protein
LSAFHGHTDTVSALIAAGANVNAASLKGGNTALMGAALSGHTAVISLLISAHANVNAVNQSGYTALKLASENNHHNATLTLLSAMPFQKVESTSAAQLMTPSIPAATFLPIAQQMTSLTIHISDNSVTATEEQKEKKNFKHPYQIK